jgi:hypothetical protein
MDNNQNVIDCTKGGKAKKAPYETTHARIPTEVKTTVESLNLAYKQLKQINDSESIENLLSRVNDAITADSVSSDSITSEVEAKLKRLEQIESIFTEWESKLVGKEKNPRYDQLNKLMAQVKSINC